MWKVSHVHWLEVKAAMFEYILLDLEVLPCTYSLKQNLTLVIQGDLENAAS